MENCHPDLDSPLLELVATYVIHCIHIPHVDPITKDIKVEGEIMAGYYEKDLAKLMRIFNKDANLVYAALRETHSEAAAKKVIQEACAEYASIVPQIPYIGGKANLMTSDLLESVKLLAFYKAMKTNGYSYEDSFHVIYKVLDCKLARIPKFIRKAVGVLQLSSVFKKRLIRQANKNRKNAYPENFVFDIVTGDGVRFDWGIEFQQCAIFKFFKSQNAEEFMPYICPNDFLVSKHFHLGLSRTMTLAEGYPRCDQYLKRGGETKVKLPPNVTP